MDCSNWILWFLWLCWWTPKRAKSTILFITKHRVSTFFHCNFVIRPLLNHVRTIRAVINYIRAVINYGKSCPMIYLQLNKFCLMVSNSFNLFRLIFHVSTWLNGDNTQRMKHLGNDEVFFIVILKGTSWGRRFPIILWRFPI